MTTVGVTARERLDIALRDYIAEASEGALLTDWVCVAAATTLEDIGTGRTLYTFICPPTQPPHITLGLIRYGADNGTIIDEEDDDD